MTTTTESPRTFIPSPHEASIYSSSPQAPIVSPQLQRLLQSPRSARSTGSYGCQREVFHPLSPHAEPSALLYYDSSEDEDGEPSPAASRMRRFSVKNAASTSSPSKRRAHISNKQSPLTAHNSSPSTKKFVSQKERQVPNVRPNALPSMVPRSPEDFRTRKRATAFNLHRRKRFSPSMNASNTFGEESPFKSRSDRPNIFSSQNLHDDFSDDELSDENTSISSETSISRDVDSIIANLPGSFVRLGIEGTEDLPHIPQSPETSARPSFSPLSDVNDLYPVLENSTSLSQGNMDESLVVPLPNSESEDSWSDSSCDLSPYRNPSEVLEPLRPNDQPGAPRTSAMLHAQALAERLAVFDRKAREYSRLASRSNKDKKYARKLDAVYQSPNRFDAREAAELEERYQQKVRTVWQRQREKELREEQIRREEEERKAREAAEAARRAAEERARREEERRRKEQQELERKRKEEEAARVQAERLRTEEEAKKQAALKAQQEKEAKAQEAQKSQEAQKRATAEAKPDLPTIPPVYGRKAVETERAAVARVLKNLKDIRKMGESNPAFIKSSGLGAIRRELRPKFGQLNGEKEQTISVRAHFKRIFEQLKNADGPTVPVSMFVFAPPENDTPIPIAFVWTANELSKLLVKQVEAECAIKPETADPIGVAIASTFADSSFLVGGKSFIDVVIARLLKRNPILLGADGPEDTEEGRIRLGWKKGDDGKWETEEEHINRLVGLTAGYTAIAGRDFGASKLVNPYPMFNLWHAVASLLNKSVEKLTNSHFFVMKTLLQVGAKKLVGVYGHQAKKLVEVAVTDWANNGEVVGGHGGASAVRAFGKAMRDETWWKES